MITREFKLYLNAGIGVAPVINANQFDQGEEWIFTLLQSDGTVYTPSTGAIIGLKQDGTTILNAGTVNSDGQVVITETEQMTAVPGSNLFEILIDGNTHGTANFVVFVERRPGDIDHPSESDISLFQEAIDAAGNVTQFQADISALQSGLSQETQTRQTQDTSLASQIAQEASTRSQQDAVLQAEIDQIIAPSGEAPSAAEVQNARIGVDGTTYDTLGNAIRTQVSDLKNAFNAGMFDDYNLFDTSTLRGTNTAVTNNGDGAFTVGTGDYGRSYFGEAVNLKAGVYYLYGVSNGESYLSTDGTYQTAIASNKNANPKAIVIKEAVTAYLCFRVLQTPSTSFVIRPFLYGTKIDVNTASIADLKSSIDSLAYNSAIPFDKWILGVIGPNGQPQQSTDRYISDYLSDAIVKISVRNGATIYAHFYDSYKAYKFTITYTADVEINLLSTNWKYCRLDVAKTRIPADIEVTIVPRITINESYEEISFTQGDIDDYGQDRDGSEYNYLARTEYINKNILLEFPSDATFFVYYYKNDHTFISKTTKTGASNNIYIGDVKGASSIRLTMVIKVAVQSKISEISPVNTTSDICISNYYESGELKTTTGAILYYPTHARMLANQRTSKMLRVIPGTTLTPKFSNGELYMLEYDKSKAFIRTSEIYNDVPYYLSSSTRFVKFEHDNNSAHGVVSVNVEGSEEMWEYNNRYTPGTISFGYKVNISYGTDIPATDLTYDSKDVFTEGLLRLPPNYTDCGEKVPIIYFAHGSGTFNNLAETEFSSNETVMRNIQYLCDEGYAVFDCFGLTDLYGPKGTTGDPMANPTCMAAIRQGIEWVCNSFNVDLNSVYVMGKSLGGIPCIAMAYERGINVKAVCALAPEIDACSVGFGYSVETRKGYADDLGFEPANSPVLDEPGIHMLYEFSTDFQNYVRANADKLLGYNPLYKGVLGLNPLEFVNYQILGNQGHGDRQELPDKLKNMQRVCAVPTKIIIAIDDPAVSYNISAAYIQSLKNGGSIGELRTLPAGVGGHYAVDRAENAPKVSSITTACGIVYTDIPLAYAELVQFFKRFK